MPYYYVSYIEDGCNCSLVVSVQQYLHARLIILNQITLAPKDLAAFHRASCGRQYFTSYEVDFIETSNSAKLFASRVLYEGAAIKHKTFPISKLEYDRLEDIIDDYRYGNLQPDRNYFNLLTNNCKSHLMFILQEIGLVEAEQLSNFGVQLVGAADKLMDKVLPGQIGNLLQESDLLFDLNQLKCICEELVEKLIDHNLRVYKTSRYLRKVTDKLQQIINLSNNLLLTSNLKNSSSEQYLQDLRVLYQQANCLVKDQFLDAITTGTFSIHRLIYDLISRAENFIPERLARYEYLLQHNQYFWVSTPELTARSAFGAFDLSEMVDYCVNIKSSYIINRLIKLKLMISQRLNCNNNQLRFIERLQLLVDIIDKYCQDIIHASHGADYQGINIKLNDLVTIIADLQVLRSTSSWRILGNKLLFMCDNYFDELQLNPERFIQDKIGEINSEQLSIYDFEVFDNRVRLYCWQQPKSVLSVWQLYKDSKEMLDGLDGPVDIECSSSIIESRSTTEELIVVANATSSAGCYRRSVI